MMQPTVRCSHSWICSLDIIKSGFAKRTKKKQASSLPSEHFCFVRMPEGLKNAGCTFSRMIAIVLHPQIRRNILAYVDDIVVKSVQRKTTSVTWQKHS
jgi:hypothetical protein